MTKYKYGTYNELLEDYAMGVSVDPNKDLAPHVLNWVSAHSFDIPRMRLSLERMRLDFQLAILELEEERLK